MQNPLMSVLTSASGATGVSAVGLTAPQRMLSEHKINGILFRTLMATMVYMFIIFLIFGIVQAAGLSEERLFSGKLVIVALSMMLGLAASFVIPLAAKKMYPALQALVD
jgi:hypothetical protein